MIPAISRACRLHRPLDLWLASAHPLGVMLFLSVAALIGCHRQAPVTSPLPAAGEIVLQEAPSPLVPSFSSAVAQQGRVIALTPDDRIWRRDGPSRWSRIDLTGLPSTGLLRSLSATKADLFVLVEWPSEQSYAKTTYYRRSEIFVMPMSGDGTWRRIDTPQNVQCRLLVADEAAAYVQCVTGVWRINDVQQQWSSLWQPSDTVDRSDEQFRAIAVGDEAIVVSRAPRSLDRSRSSDVGAAADTPPERILAFDKRTLQPLPVPPDVLQSSCVHATSNLSLRRLALLPSLAAAYPTTLVEDIRSIVRCNGIEAVGTGERLFLRFDTGPLSIVNDSLARAAVSDLVDWNHIRVVVAGDRLFAGAGDSSTWREVRRFAARIRQVEARDGELAVLTSQANSQEEGRTMLWTLGTNFEMALAKGLPDSQIHGICALRERLYAVAGKKLYVSEMSGRDFTSLADVPEGSRGPSCLADSVFLSAEQTKIYRMRVGQPSWEHLSEGLESTLQFLHVAEPLIFSITFEGEMYQLDETPSAARWRKLTRQYVGKEGAAGALGEQVNRIGRATLAIWLDPRDHAVMIESTAAGLAWSNDGGATFHRSSDWNRPRVSITGFHSFGRELIGTSRIGLYSLRETIPRPLRLAEVRSWILAHISEVALVSVIVVFLLVASTRLILIVLQFDIPVMRWAARVFYLTRYGRWRLYRAYRRTMLRRPELTTLRHRFVDVPYLWNGHSDPSVPLVERLTALPNRTNIVLIGRGGSGKSSICLRLVSLALERQFIPGGRRREAVLIEGFSYDGDMLKALVRTLKLRGAYVSETIVEGQLALGQFVVVFDGFSEIRQSEARDDGPPDLVRFVTQWPDNLFVFSSRTPITKDLERALGDSVAVSLPELDGQTERSFLAKYLNRPESAEQVQQQLAERFASLPRIPLMLRLVASYYNKNGTVPQSKADLFADFTRELLRPEALGLPEVAGVHYAAELLVRETFVARNGDRGFLEQDGVEVLIKARETLEKGFGLALPAIGVLRLLERSGLLRKEGRDWRFFHDSFESYYAARVFEAMWRKGDARTVGEKLRQPRLDETAEFLREMIGGEIVGTLMTSHVFTAEIPGRV